MSNPANPQRVGGYDTSAYAFGVAVNGNHAYVADGPWSLMILTRVASSSCGRMKSKFLCATFGL
jgi:hypothetical protein